MLSAEAFVARAQRRASWVAHVVVAVSVGVMAAASISLVAGSRRSASVVDRYLGAAPRYDVRIFSESSAFEPGQIRGLPNVERADISEFVPFALLGPSLNQAPHDINGSTFDFSVPDPTSRLVQGRKPASAENEAVVNEAFVDELGLSVGTTLSVRAFGVDQLDEVENGIYEPHGPVYDFTIVGVVRAASDIAFDETRSPRANADASENEMTVPAKFWEVHHSEFLDFGITMAVRLRSGSNVDSFVDDLRERLGPGNDLKADEVTPSRRGAAFHTPVDTETTVLLAVGLGAAIGSAALALLLLRLQQRPVDRDRDIFRSLGLTTNQLSVIACLRVFPAALGAALLASVVPIVLSGRYPIGLGRQLELVQGVDINVAVTIGGALVLVVWLLAIAALLARSGRSRIGAITRRRARASAGTIVPIDIALGSSLAIGTWTNRRASSWLGLTTATLGLVSVLGVSTYIVGADRLYRDPDRRGWTWDVAIGNSNFFLDAETVADIQRHPMIVASTPVRYGQLAIDSIPCEVLAFDLGGDVLPSVRRGKIPASANEVALGAGLMRKLDVDIGDVVVLSTDESEFTTEAGQATDLDMTVVGESVVPVFGESDLADVGLVPIEAIIQAGGNPSPSMVLADVIGPDHQASIATLAKTRTEELDTDVIPSRIVNMRRVLGVPIAGQLLAAGFTAIAVAATIIAASRSNRRTLAILVALGLDARGARRGRVWQGIIVATITLLIGIPLGVLAGQALWTRVTDDIGVESNVSVLTLTMPAIATVITMVAVATALLSSHHKRHSTLATALRAE